MLIPKDPFLKLIVLQAAKDGVAIAELEYLGLSLRVINTLEEKLSAIFISDIINLDEEKLTSVKQLGKLGMQQIMSALHRLGELERQKERWHQGSEKASFYMKNINTKVILS